MSELKLNIEFVEELPNIVNKAKSESEENFDLRKKSSYKRLSKEENDGNTYDNNMEKRGMTTIKQFILEKEKRKKENNNLVLYSFSTKKKKSDDLIFSSSKKLKEKIQLNEIPDNEYRICSKESIQLQFNPSKDKNLEKQTDELITECIKNDFSFEKTMNILENEKLVMPNTLILKSNKNQSYSNKKTIENQEKKFMNKKVSNSENEANDTDDTSSCQNKANQENKENM